VVMAMSDLRARNGREERQQQAGGFLVLGERDWGLMGRKE